MIGVTNAFNHFWSGYSGQPVGLLGNHGGHPRYCSQRKVGKEEFGLLYKFCGRRAGLRLLYPHYPLFYGSAAAGDIPQVDRLL
jgi:hypothetical protein